MARYLLKVDDGRRTSGQLLAASPGHCDGEDSPNAAATDGGAGAAAVIIGQHLQASDLISHPRC